MDENRIAGTAKEWRGRIQSAVGNATGYEPDLVGGRRRQAEGRAEDLYGRAEDAARVIRRHAGTRGVGHRIGEHPALALFVAGAVGYGAAFLVRRWR